MIRENGVLPIFVVGSPRSGTTMLGEYIGSAQEILNTGEYTGFYFAEIMSRDMIVTKPSPYVSEFCDSLFYHALDFIEQKTLNEKKTCYVDATPWNLLLSKKLSEVMENALFVCSLRHFAGVVQSLERSHIEGYTWAGNDFKERMNLYVKFYENINALPSDRTIFFDYDKFCQDPEKILNKFDEEFFNFTKINSLDRSTFAVGHHNHNKKKIAIIEDNNIVKYGPIVSYDEKNWSIELNELGLSKLKTISRYLATRGINKNFEL